MAGCVARDLFSTLQLIVDIGRRLPQVTGTRMVTVIVFDRLHRCLCSVLELRSTELQSFSH